MSIVLRDATMSVRWEQQLLFCGLTCMHGGELLECEVSAV